MAPSLSLEARGRAARVGPRALLRRGEAARAVAVLDARRLVPGDLALELLELCLLFLLQLVVLVLNLKLFDLEIDRTKCALQY